MRRFFVPPGQSCGPAFELPEREARHAAQVLRLEAGDDLTVLDGAGGVLTCAVEAVSKRTIRVIVRDRQQRPALPCAITLIQAVPKGPAFETIIQKATELGASRIIPLLSERVVAHINPRDAAAKVEKWQQIAIESIKQCGSPWLPVIEAPQSLAEVIKKPGLAELTLVCSLEAGSQNLRDLATSFRNPGKQSPRSVAVWIGPEGDFTPAEYAAIQATGAQPITLGPLVLRADTAAITALAILNHEFQTA